MKTKFRQSGLSLVEEVIIIAAAALLIFLGLPAARMLFDQMHTPAGVQATISSALASAKAIAAKEQRYAGIRFQHAYDVQQPPKSPLKQPQYIVFIINDYNNTNLVNGFRAVEGIEPIELPQNIGVMDLYVNQNNPIANNNANIDQDPELIDATTFSIIFSPAGKLVVHDVQTRNRDGYTITSVNDSEDDIFNKEQLVRQKIALFLQDDYQALYGLDIEPSRRCFIIYDRNEFKKITAGLRWTDYLRNIETVYINPYIGTIINR